ncbi:hypothetical protein AB4Y90_17385 [Chryseobacterium sp. 2TAF14]|uniref:hypothetical protein n=1 Tax=Chryseobacterium sp. 2TAF14 TaxID=3233007 RepID=UPI003F900789
MVEGNINHSMRSAKIAFGDRAKNLESKGLLDNYCQDRPQKRLYNYLYAHENGYGNGNGNEASEDGWKFRGRGLKQLTGRANYKNASETLREIFPNEYIDLEANPEKVEEIKYAVLTAIAFWEKHEVWKEADKVKSTNDSDELFKQIRKKVVGKSAFKWKDAKDYFTKTYKAFKVNECQKDNAQSINGEYNLYKTNYIKKTYSKAMTSESKTYKFEVYKNGVLEKSYTLEKSEHGYFNFPESGINWGRYGTRDSKSIGGDNWANEECVAALLGSFILLKKVV